MRVSASLGGPPFLLVGRLPRSTFRRAFLACVVTLLVLLVFLEATLSPKDSWLPDPPFFGPCHEWVVPDQYPYTRIAIQNGSRTSDKPSSYRALRTPTMIIRGERDTIPPLIHGHENCGVNTRQIGELEMREGTGRMGRYRGPPKQRLQALPPSFFIVLTF